MAAKQLLLILFACVVYGPIVTTDGMIFRQSQLQSSNVQLNGRTNAQFNSGYFNNLDFDNRKISKIQSSSLHNSPNHNSKFARTRPLITRQFQGTSNHPNSRNQCLGPNNTCRPGFRCVIQKNNIGICQPISVVKTSAVSRSTPINRIGQAAAPISSPLKESRIVPTIQLQNSNVYTVQCNPRWESCKAAPVALNHQQSHGVLKHGEKHMLKQERTHKVHDDLRRLESNKMQNKMTNNIASFQIPINDMLKYRNFLHNNQRPFNSNSNVATSNIHNTVMKHDVMQVKPDIDMVSAPTNKINLNEMSVEGHKKKQMSSNDPLEHQKNDISNKDQTVVKETKMINDNKKQTMELKMNKPNNNPEVNELKDLIEQSIQDKQAVQRSNETNSSKMMEDSMNKEILNEHPMQANQNVLASNENREVGEIKESRKLENTMNEVNHIVKGVNPSKDVHESPQSQVKAQGGNRDYYEHHYDHNHDGHFYIHDGNFHHHIAFVPTIDSISGDRYHGHQHIKSTEDMMGHLMKDHVMDKYMKNQKRNPNQNIQDSKAHILPPPSDLSTCDGAVNYHSNGDDFLVTSVMKGCRPMSWSEAVDFCHSKNMAVVSFGSSIDNAKANRILNIAKLHQDAGFWTGGYIHHPEDQRVPNTVVWVSRFPESNFVHQIKKYFSHGSKLAYSNGQPDNYEYIRMGNHIKLKENCVAMMYNHFGDDGAKLHDLACHHQLNVVCEKQKMPEPWGLNINY